jgi:hypothetical protein
MDAKLKMAFALMGLFLIGGCATIPSEAPQLSAQLGTRISAVETSHRRLLADFFDEKRKRVDEFIQEEWVPLFAQELFTDSKIVSYWEQVVKSQDRNERLKFLVLVGPRLQKKINAKRLELIQPLDDLERTIALRLKSEYDNMRAINNTLTTFLLSASKVEETRRRYLETVGIGERQIYDFINDTDLAITELLGVGKEVKEIVKDTETYKTKIDDIIKKIRQ